MITNNTKRNGHEKVNLIIDMRAVRNDGGAGANFFLWWVVPEREWRKDHHDLRYEGKESLRDERGPEDLHGDGGDRQVIHQ